MTISKPNASIAHFSLVVVADCQGRSLHIITKRQNLAAQEIADAYKSS